MSLLPEQHHEDCDYRNSHAAKHFAETFGVDMEENSEVFDCNLGCEDASRHAHTPGPWRAGEPDGMCEDYIFAGKHIIASVHMVGDEWEPSDSANARLIAAAPAMLEALRYARDVIVPILGYQDGAVQAIDSAIQSATEGTRP